MQTRGELHDTIMRTHSGLSEEQWQDFNLDIKKAQWYEQRANELRAEK